MFEFELPDVGEGVAEGEIVAWHVEPGDSVAEDQVLAEVETDKAVVDLPSPVAGVVEELHAEPGDIVAVGSVVVTIDTGDDSPEADSEQAVDSESEGGVDASETDDAGDTSETGDAGDASETDDAGEISDTSAADSRVFAPPHVRRLARELGVDIHGVAGSGPGGRVTEGDVRSAASAESADETSDTTTAESADDETGETAASADAETNSAVRRIESDESATAASATDDLAESVETADREQTLAAPATRKLARDLGVDIDAVPTESRRDGEPFVEEADVRAHAESADTGTTSTESTEATPEGVETTAELDEASHAEVADAISAASNEQAGKPVSREPYRGIRRTIGEQMSESARTIPHATHHDTAVVPRLVETRETLRERAQERGTSLTYMPFLLRAVVAGLEAYPVLNTELDEEGEEIIYRQHYDIGVAVATDAGLMVPVVERVDQKGLFELAAEIEDLVERARSRDLAPAELTGGTFTVTNFGVIGGEYATPIINHPETAILGTGAIEPRPVVADGEVVARETLPLSLSIDHRVIDGAEAAQFCNTVIEHVEHPALLL